LHITSSVDETEDHIYSTRISFHCALYPLTCPTSKNRTGSDLTNTKATSPAHYGHLEKGTGRFSQNWAGVTKWCHCYICTYGLQKGGPIILAVLTPQCINLLITESNSEDYNGILCSKITIIMTVHTSIDMKPTSLNRTSVSPSDIAQNYQ
jgi:hypothetical protein